MSVNKSAGSVSIRDRDTGLNAAVETVGGKNRILADVNISSVNVPNGRDPIPDTYFTITAAGAIGDTMRMQVVATTKDSTTPDRDLPAVDYTYTLVAGDVGDERKLAENFVLGANADTNFQNAFLKAFVVTGEKRAMVHITSTEFSNGGEFHERGTVGDFTVTTTGTTTIMYESTDYQRIVSRAKETSLDRDPDNPHKLGILGVAGSVSINPGALSNRFQVDLVDSGSATDLAVDGSTVSVDYTLDADPDFDLFVTELRIHGTDNGIKYGQWMGINSKLTTGLTWAVKSDDQTVQLDILKSTEDVKARFSSLGGWDLDVQAGGDHMLGILDFDVTPIVIRAQGTFAIDDQIKITVNDDLTQVTELFVTAIGFKRTP